MRKSFTDPITGCILDAVEMNVEVPDDRLWWGRKLGYTDDEIHEMYWRDKRAPKYLDAIQEEPLSEAQAKRFATNGQAHS